MTPQPKKKKVKKLTVVKVQEAVNKAIRERDGDCLVRDGRHQCAGVLTASHYYPVGGNSAFRFYPPNINTQCFGHHGIHERKQDPFFYKKWMESCNHRGLEFMERRYFASIKYSQPVLKDIYEMAKARKLDELTEYIENLLA